MLKTHMDTVENVLVHTSRVPANSGHSLHKGTPREAFITQFLHDHLSSSVAIGTGEIIDSSSSPGAQRNQFDIVIYKKHYPKLHFGGGIDGFLIESVIATIEVKSTLSYEGILQSVKAANAAKLLQPSTTRAMRSGWIPPKVLNFVVAYDGPASMSTAHKWIVDAHTDQNIAMPSWTQTTKLSTPGTAVDGVFVLNKGFIKLDNAPLSFNTHVPPATAPYAVCDTGSGNLLLLFLALQEACNNLESAWLDPSPYLLNASYPAVKFV